MPDSLRRPRSRRYDEFRACLLESSHPGVEMEERLAGIDSGMVADALDALGVDGAMTGLTPLSTGLRFFGPAVTVRMLRASLGSFHADDIALGRMLDATGTGDVLVVDVGSAPVTVWGELTTLAAQAKGLAGLVVDGGVRDADIIRAARFPVVARHVVPTAGKTRLRLGTVNQEPVLCGGVTVRPGDFIFGDETGAVSCPRERIEEVLLRVRQIQEREAAMKAHLAKGLTYLEAARELGLRQL